MKTFNSVAEIHAERQNQKEDKVIYTMLGVLLGEIDRLPTRATPTPEQIYTVVNKMYNNAKEMAPYSNQSLIEMDYLKQYIKEQLTVEKLTDIIICLKLNGCKNVGEFMKALNADYKGQFDGKVASGIINTVLKG
jgi:uncharacterized protein YqeY